MQMALIWPFDKLVCFDIVAFSFLFRIFTDYDLYLGLQLQQEFDIIESSDKEKSKSRSRSKSKSTSLDLKNNGSSAQIMNMPSTLTSSNNIKLTGKKRKFDDTNNE